MVEEFMIVSNLLVSKFLKKNKLYFISRNHQPPTKKKSVLINKFIFFLRQKSNTESLKYFTINFYLKIMRIMKSTPGFIIFQSILLNAFEKAIYNNMPDGHFGLNVSNYTHFTSPIRRYSDLVIHRIVKFFLNEKKIKYNKVFLKNISESCSSNEIKICRIDKKIKYFFIFEFFIRNINKIYDANIVDINKFAFIIFISQTDTYGLISNFHIYKQKKLKKYKINEKIEVKLLYINEVKAILNFHIYERL